MKGDHLPCNKQQTNKNVDSSFHAFTVSYAVNASIFVCAIRSHSVWATLARGCGWLGRKVAFQGLDVLAALAGSWRPLLTRMSPGYVTILVTPLQLSVQLRISCAFPRFDAAISVRRYALFLVGWSAVP